MQVAVRVDIAGGTEPLYEQVIAEVFPEGKLPESFLVHVATPQVAFFPVHRREHRHDRTA